MKSLVKKMVEDCKRRPCLKDEDYDRLRRDKEAKDYIVRSMLGKGK